MFSTCIICYNSKGSLLLSIETKFFHTFIDWILYQFWISFEEIIYSQLLQDQNFLFYHSMSLLFLNHYYKNINYFHFYYHIFLVFSSEFLLPNPKHLKHDQVSTLYYLLIYQKVGLFNQYKLTIHRFTHPSAPLQFSACQRLHPLDPCLLRTLRFASHSLTVLC